MDTVLIIDGNKLFICDRARNALIGEPYMWLGNDFQKMERHISNTNTCGNMGGARLKIIYETRIIE